MNKIKNKKTTFYFFSLTILIYILIIVANYFLGSIRIIEAHQNQFGGGMCGVYQSYLKPICGSKSGFDTYYLYLSLLLFTFIVGFINVIWDKNLMTNILIVFISALSYMILTEIIIKTMNIPVLYTEFQEGRQSLSFSAFSKFNIGYNIIPLFLSVISSLAGNIVGFPCLVIKKKLFKK